MIQTNLKREGKIKIADFEKQKDDNIIYDRFRCDKNRFVLTANGRKIIEGGSIPVKWNREGVCRSCIDGKLLPELNISPCSKNSDIVMNDLTTRLDHE